MKKLKGQRNKNITCWEVFKCKKKKCPAYKSEDIRCWLFPATRCREEIRGKFIEKMEMCLDCKFFKSHIEKVSLKDTLKVINNQFKEYKKIVTDRDKKLISINKELALGITQVFQALRKISSGDPTIRLDEKSKIKLISKLKHVVNQTAKEVRESEDVMRFTQVALDHTADAAFWMKSDARFIYVNKAACRSLGYSRDELLSMTVHDIDPLFPKKAWADHWQNIKKRKSFTFESHHKTKDGRIFPVEITVNFVVFGGNEYNCAFARDISMRKQAQEKLYESEERYRQLFVAETDAILVYDAETKKFVAVNDAATRIYGYNKRDFLNMKRMAISSQPKVFEKSLKGVLSGKVLEVPLTYHKKKNGTIFPVEIAASSYTSRGRKIVFEVIKDITLRRQAEEALRESEEKFRAISNAAVNAILVIDNDGKITYWNPAAERIFGYTSKEAIGKELHKFITPGKYRDAFIRGFRRFKQTGQGPVVGVTSEFSALRKDRTEFPIEVSTSSAFIGGKWHAVGIIRDITERKKAEEDLKKSHDNLRALSSFITDLGEAQKRRLARELHDLVGQKLTALSINLDFMIERASDETKKGIGSRLHDSKDLVKEIMKLIRNVMSDLRPLILDDYGLTAAIHWYSEQFTKRTKIPVVFRGNELKTRLLPDIETNLFRIVQESLTNIAKYANAHKVAITLEEVGDHLNLSIIDDGIGFDLANIIQSKEKKGLGLISMKERAEAMGGILHVESSPGKGTRIIVEVKK